jgi:hypothetical protein
MKVDTFGTLYFVGKSQENQLEKRPLFTASKARDKGQAQCSIKTVVWQMAPILGHRIGTLTAK